MKRGCLITSGIGLLIAISLGLFVAARYRDIPPVDDSDLFLPARNIDPAQNPFPEIRSFALSADARKSAVRAWSMIHGEEAADDAFITNILSIEAKTLDRFDAFSRMTDWRNDEEITVDSELPYLSNWVAIARLKAVETRQELRANQIESAIESGLTILRFADGVHRSEGGFVHQMVGATIAHMGIVELLTVVESGKVPPDLLAGLDAELSQLAFSPEIFGQAYVVEYRTFEKVIDDLATGRVNIGQLQSSVDNPSIPGNPPSSFFFKRNKTTKLLADAYRQFIAEVGMIRSEAPGQPISDAKAMRENSGALYFSGNLVGRILFTIIVPAIGQLNDTRATVEVALDLLRIRVAMEQYRIEKEDWPKDLESLVPDYLDNVPADAMNGQPVRYSREKKVIYSVGVDFVDNGGHDPKREGSLKSRDEIVIELRSDATGSK